MPHFFLKATPSTNGKYGLHCKPCDKLSSEMKLVPLGFHDDVDVALKIAKDIVKSDELYICPHCLGEQDAKTD